MKIRIISLLTVLICLVVSTATANDVYERMLYFFNQQEIPAPAQVNSSAGIGDIDLNGFPYKPHDAVVFANYFVRGDAAFTVSVQDQIDATDINQDGETLKVEDLVQLIRIQTGELRPDSTIDITLLGNNFVQNDVSAKKILYVTDHKTDVIWLKFDGQIMPKNYQTHSAQLFHYFDGTNSRVIMSLLFGYGPGQFQLFEYDGSGELEEAQACNFKGEEIDLDIDLFPTDVINNPNILPESFTVHQNYPNPFNNETRIAFELPVAADVTFEIFNLLGQTVYSLKQKYSPGIHSIAWEGQDKKGNTVATGVYYYRLIAGDFVDSKKMILLK